MNKDSFMIRITRKKIIQILIGTAAFFACLLLFILFRALINLPDRKELQNFKQATASIVLSSEHEIIGKIYTENRTNVTYDQIPEHLVNALIATEDVRFYKHKGIDKKSLLRVIFKTILLNKKGSGGGSTISQQLAKNLFGRNLSGFLSMPTIKIRELILAQRIEKVFTKNEIITLYLNTVPFGENVYGIEAAAQRYYNKKIERLNIQESAVLVGMLKANSRFNPRLYPENAKRRRNIVIGQMEKYRYITANQSDSLQNLPVEINYRNIESSGPADYFVYQIRQEAERILAEINDTASEKWNIEEDGLIITTTLNLAMQEAANQAFRKHMSVMQQLLDQQYRSRASKRQLNQLLHQVLRSNNLTKKSEEIGIRPVFSWSGIISDSMTLADSIRHNLKLLQAGLIGLDPRDGAIKSWVGGIDFKTQPYDQILARRQTGSTFKPILFAAALESGMSPCDYLDNDSVIISGYDGWSPQNFDHTKGGKYSMTGALVHSMNIPTFNLYLKTGYLRVDSLWRNMGFSYNLVNTPSLSLGTAEASILEVATGYAVFANGGYKIEPYMIQSIKTSDGKVIWNRKSQISRKRILSEHTCELIGYMLQRAVNEGTGSPLRSLYGVSLPIAGKTGTTQDYTDAWFASFSPSIVIVSRVGASNPSVRFNSGRNGTGSALALPLVALTLKRVQNNAKVNALMNRPFPEVEASDFDCPDFKEDSGFEEFIRMFRRENRPDSLRTKKRKPFFKRLFGNP